jgi:hypothetical protein
VGDDPNYTDHGIVVPDDIVQRLERHAAGSQRADGSTHWAEVGPSLARAALTEIERLQAELAAWQATVRAHEYLAAKAADEIKRLRAAGDEMADDVLRGYESLRHWQEARRG